METDYQLIILGGGPGGLSAGIYAARNRLNTLLLEKSMIGGLSIYAELLENYPGFPDGIGGLELGQLMLKQAEKFGLKTLTTEVTGLQVENSWKILKTTGGDFKAKAIIIAMGSERINLNIPGEKEFVGRGVSYCATCDAAFFKQKPVVVVGGGNSAITEAIHLTKFASQVTLIHRREQFRASRISVEKARSESKINFLLNTIIESIEGKDNVETLHLINTLSGQKSTLPVSGLFVSIGQKPNTDLFKDLLSLDSNGYIIANEKMETSLPGVFAIGDIRSNSIRQCISAAGDGATAAIYADRYIGE
jgi:thioredoxin reductase (NADPH)